MVLALQQSPRSIESLIQLLPVILTKLHPIFQMFLPAPQQDETATQKLICQLGDLDKSYHIL